MDKLLPRVRVAPGEHGSEVLGRHGPPEPDLRREGADPPASALSPTCVVVLGRRSDLADVVLASSGREKSDVQHADLTRIFQ